MESLQERFHAFCLGTIYATSCCERFGFSQTSLNCAERSFFILNSPFRKSSSILCKSSSWFNVAKAVNEVDTCTFRCLKINTANSLHILTYVAQTKPPQIDTPNDALLSLLYTHPVLPTHDCLIITWWLRAQHLLWLLKYKNLRTP